MTYVPLFLVFCTGFVIPLMAYSWRGLGISLLVSAAIVVVAIRWSGTGGGFMMFVFAGPIIIFAFGTVAGLVTRCVMLFMRWPLFSSKGMAAAILGLIFVPFFWHAYGWYNTLQSENIYAALPDASTLPDVTACLQFRDAGPLLDAVLTKRSDEIRANTLPVSDMAVRYPAAYMEPFPPRFPKDGMKWSELQFEMYVENARPAPQEDETDANGDFIPLMERAPSVSFRFSSDLPVSRSAAHQLNTFSGRYGETEILPSDLKLSESAIARLQLVVAPEPRVDAGNTETYVAMHGAEISEYLRCQGRGRVPNPQCTFQFDVAGLPIAGRFRLANLPEWENIRANVRNFAECSVAAAKI
ncbi:MULTISPECIES: hypothetical protein [unclassified Rhizobium]|uniref:hypothetical protein n=1 Tax=unclassified Rhizobium TaxID=2613769 RepID=UPI000715B5B9|nr:MULTISPECIES: hypothetical protein [unclassified Rhizobium]KQS93813.1 hypothetical protein ASG50_06790 [Rhizobium sp. Leaf386]KQT06671.1 hypothetical protein ASG42_03595 [Rhizobium sp. Leaf391]KQU05100.1 hypothetical protein ASG68_26455 [Rhizobium sp. Leaf453]